MTASPAPSSSAPFADLGARVDEISSRVVDRRRYLHERPELSYEESETSAFIVAELERIGGFAEISQPTPTSVVADLRGGLPGPRIAVRSDHDALPIEEATGLPFASKNPGVMHACGHDGHTSMMLGVAEVLAPLADSLTGEVRFLFEHGEEALPGGASQMVAAGAMEGVDRVLGQHLWAWFPLGKVSVRPGPVMASCDVFEIVVNGHGGHISKPQDAIDPLAIGAQIVTNLQHLVAREVDPQEIAVVGVTQFEAGESVGVIPQTARLEGGTNMFSPAIRDLLERRIGEIAAGICAAHGATCDYDYTRGYDAVVNDPETTEIVAAAARRALGDDAVYEGDLILGGEDFSAFQAQAPGTFLHLGATDPEVTEIHDHHHPRFDIDERALPNGVKVIAESVVALLAEGRP
ncbi:MAG TPA: amidohydrolase [Solirubrobacterales bacterium]